MQTKALSLFSLIYLLKRTRIEAWNEKGHKLYLKQQVYIMFCQIDCPVLQVLSLHKMCIHMRHSCAPFHFLSLRALTFRRKDTSALPTELRPIVLRCLNLMSPVFVIRIEVSPYRWRQQLLKKSFPKHCSYTQIKS